jgi:hypothetical protein
VSLKSTVHFSTWFSTTRTSCRQSGTLLSRRPRYSRLRHFLDDFGERRFGRLLFFFSFIHTFMISRIWTIYWSVVNKRSRRDCPGRLILLQRFSTFGEVGCWQTSLIPPASPGEAEWFKCHPNPTPLASQSADVRLRLAGVEYLLPLGK